ncbi:hypothetical protein Ssi03_50760 [Sphaerisporangium siamense]|uniref:DNA-binding protein n=1 Tax=Sphaerisporangium siamense TaxID=795645 RepID=A0A7W7GAX7_9ACTN|nr:hypothetical protein [Sphaerisporangium siamense]MBB4702220.1 hypothetical protein [Sphaerisporangium siamense]GII87086.1 hypothetical protein Ssi03_50760 [Sphaerisporangium siamense]
MIVELPALERETVEGFLLAGGVLGVQEPPIREPITIAAAAARLGRPEPTVRVWASRHHALKLRKRGKTAWYDWHDLKTISRQLDRGEPVPQTPEERDALRAQLRAARASALP